MTRAGRAPIVHLVLGALLGLAFLIGGQVTIQDWGGLSVRWLTAYLGAALLVHGLSRQLDTGGLATRGLAWTIVALMPLHLTVLLRAEVLVPVLALAGVDLAQHRTDVTSEVDLPAGTLGKGIASLATAALLALLGVLAPLASSPAVLLRLGLVAVIAWALIGLFALRPAVRTPFNLLAGAGAFALTFALLAGPVLPLGPLMTYWATILAVATAALTATFSGSEASLREEHEVHEQTVRSLPDPVLAPLTQRIRDFVTTGEGGPALADRMDPSSRELSDRVRDLRDEGLPARAARRQALAETLDADLDPKRGDRP